MKSQTNTHSTGPSSGLILLSLAVLFITANAVRAAAPTFYDNRAAFMAALQSAQVKTQNFNGFSYGTDLSGATLLSGVTVSSTFSLLTVWNDGSLFGYDGSTRIAGNGAYSFSLSGYNAAGFDILSWDPNSPGPATAIIQLNDGTTHQVQRRQTGPSESTPVFFGVIADQPVVRIEWHESPEIYGGGNEEVSLDNLVCAVTTNTPPAPTAPTLPGTWEPDTYTGHAARLVIRQSGADWFIHGYGSCSPTFCDWGEAPLKRVQPHNANAFDGWFAVWEFGFKTTYLWLHFDGQSLVVDSVDVFADWDGRAPYSVLSRMHKLQPQPLSVTRSTTTGALVVKVPAATTGVKLQYCGDLKCGTWLDVPLPEGATEHVVPPAGTQGFFRLVPVAE